MKKREIFKKLWKNQTSHGYGFLAFRLALLMGSILLSLALDGNPNLTTLRYRLYQYQLHFAHNPELPPQRVAVITIDDADYWGNDFAGRSPLNRSELAAILDKLRAAGVNTVVLDVDLRSPCPDANGPCPDAGTKQQASAAPTVAAQDFQVYQSEDAALYSSIAAFCSSGRNVVLGGSLLYKGDGYVAAPQIFAPDALPKCVQHGYLQLPFDVRQLPATQQLENGQELDSLSMAAVRIDNPTAYRLANQKSTRGFRYVRYLTENDFDTHDGRRFSYPWHELKDADENTLRRDLADKIVLIGGHWHAYAPGQGPTVDSYDSPAGKSVAYQSAIWLVYSAGCSPAMTVSIDHQSHGVTAGTTNAAANIASARVRLRQSLRSTSTPCDAKITCLVRWATAQVRSVSLKRVSQPDCSATVKPPPSLRFYLFLLALGAARQFRGKGATLRLKGSPESPSLSPRATSPRGSAA